MNEKQTPRERHGRRFNCPRFEGRLADLQWCFHISAEKSFRHKKLLHLCTPYLSSQCSCDFSFTCFRARGSASACGCSSAQSSSGAARRLRPCVAVVRIARLGRMDGRREGGKDQWRSIVGVEDVAGTEIGGKRWEEGRVTAPGQLPPLAADRSWLSTPQSSGFDFGTWQHLISGFER